MIGHLFGIVAIAVVVSLFWRQQQQNEIARKHIERRCEQLNLQLISIARGEHKFTWLIAPFSVTTRYYFEFSVSGMDCFQGYVSMRGNRAQEMYIPPYPM